jgi:uncharacterized protein YqgC (DUF456 family)
LQAVVQRFVVAARFVVMRVKAGCLPLVGAALGEYLARQDHGRAAKVGVATWVGIVVGLVAKVVISFIMVGIFIAALLI